jgi:hypothetical protein
MFTPRRPLKLRIRDATGVHTRRVTSDASGRVTVTISLGPSNRYQQYTVQADRTPRRTVTAAVRFGPAS